LILALFFKRFSKSNTAMALFQLTENREAMHAPAKMIHASIPFVVSILFCLIGQFIRTAAATTESLEPYHVAVSSQAMGSVESSDAIAALKAWAIAVKNEQHLPRYIAIELVTSSITEISTAFLQGRYHGIALTAEEFLETGLHPEEVFVGKRADGPYLRYVIVTANNDRFQSPMALRGKKLVTSQSSQMVMAQPWLTTLLGNFDHGQKQASPTTTENLAKAILEVFFGQADGALVTKEAFELAGELNPQVRKKLKIICESPPIIPVLFVFQPDTAKTLDMTALKRALSDLHKTPGGQQVLTVIQSRTLEKHPSSVLASTIALIEEYRALRKSAD